MSDILSREQVDYLVTIRMCDPRVAASHEALRDALTSKEQALGEYADNAAQLYGGLVEVADARIAELERLLAKVRRRVIHDFYAGVSPQASHWATCRLCEWVWKWGEPELHDLTCPMKKETP